MATSEAITSTRQPALAAGTLGLWGQLFQAVTHMAPAAGIVFSTQYMASQGGASHALAYVIATIACTLSALCLKELVKKVRSAGGYFVIHSVALGDAAGFTTSWLYFIYDPVIVAAGSLLWPTIFTNFLRTYLGIDLPWWPFAIVMAGTLFVVTYIGVKQAVVVSMILGTIETLLFALFGLILIAKAGGNQPLVSFAPASSPTAYGGLMFASVFAILSFIGFESGVPMAEESNNARRNVIIGLMVSTVGIGLFYIAMGYATVAGWSGVQAEGSTYINFANFSHDDAVNFGKEFSGAQDPYFTLGERAFGAAGPLLMLLMLTNSMFAVGVAATNASTRVVFSLGRAKILPGILGHISARTRTPDVSIAFVSLAGLLIALFFGLVIGPDPITAYGLMGLLATIGAIVLYLMTNASTFLLYKQKYPREFKFVDHAFWPLLATILFVPPLIVSLWPRSLDIIGMGFDTTYPVSLALPFTIAWAVIGTAFYIYLRVLRPQALLNLATEMERVRLVGEEDEPVRRVGVQ
jgi:amino acid transporter